MNPIHVMFQESGDTPQLEKLLVPPINDMTANPNLAMCVDKRGVVTILSAEPGSGSFVAQTTLNKLYIATNSMTAGAGARWNWQPQIGTGTAFTTRDKGILLARIKTVIDDF